jgi:hypothetical protein
MYAYAQIYPTLHRNPPRHRPKMVAALFVEKNPEESTSNRPQAGPLRQCDVIGTANGTGTNVIKLFTAVSYNFSK